MVEREVGAATQGEVTLSDEYQREAAREGVLGAVTGVLLVLAVLLMVDKPGVS
jgi:hypothetical protein